MKEKIRKLNKWLTQYTGFDIVGVILLSSGILYIFLYAKLDKLSENLTAAILWITTVAIIQYTKETYKLRRINETLLDSSRETIQEMERSRKIEFLPIIDVTGVAKDYNTFVVNLENIGKGLAQDIRFWFPTHVDPHEVNNISERVVPATSTHSLNVQPSTILRLPEHERRIKVEYLDVFGRKIITWASVIAETTEENHPRKDHLAIGSWWLELP